jgi:hypothetical protein
LFFLLIDIAIYSVPQSLVHMGILQYSSELQQLLESKEPLAYGSRQEVEIRGASIWAVEQLRLCMLNIRTITHCQNDSPINAILLDFYLWDFAKDSEEALSSVPTHRTRSIFY